MPHVEDGYTRIANELLEAILRYDFSKREQKIVLAVIRKTYGFGKKSDDISLTQLAELTGLAVPHISASIRDLSEKGVLLIREGKYGKHLGLSKDYKNWKRKTRGYQNSNVTKAVTRGYQNGNKRVTKTVTTKENSKEIKDIGQTYSETFLKFWESYPKKQGKFEAAKMFKKVGGDELLNVILEDVFSRVESDSRFETKQYTPRAATYLNRREWEDGVESEQGGMLEGLT